MSELSNKCWHCGALIWWAESPIANRWVAIEPDGSSTPHVCNKITPSIEEQIRAIEESINYWEERVDRARGIVDKALCPHTHYYVTERRKKRIDALKAALNTLQERQDDGKYLSN